MRHDDLTEVDSEIEIGISEEAGEKRVVILFPEPTVWFSIPPDEARAMAAALSKGADMIEFGEEEDETE